MKALAASTGVHTIGDGPPVLLLHGLPTGGWLWEGVALALAAHGRRAIALDLPGYGDTPCPADAALSQDWHAAWLDAVLARLDLDPLDLVLVGHDYGGLLAADLAARRGARHLVLTSTMTGRLWAPIKATAWPLAERFFYRRYGGRRWLAMAADPSGPLLDRAATTLADPSLPDRMRATAAGIDLRRCAAIAPALRDRVPVTCLWGGDDRSMPPLLGRHTARRCGGRFVAIAGGRHAVMWEQPGAYADHLVGALR